MAKSGQPLGLGEKGVKDEAVLFEHDELFATALGVLQQLRRDLDQSAIVVAGERLIESDVHGFHRGGGADLAIHHILQHRRVLALSRIAQDFYLVADLDGRTLSSLAIKSLFLILDEKGDPGFLVHHGARHLYPVAECALGRKLQQAADPLRGDIKWVRRGGLLNHQIRLTRDKQPEAEQLPQPVKQRGANAPHFDHALDQFLRVGDGQLPRVGGKPFAANHQLDQVAPRLLLKPHGADGAADFNKLTVLAAADQLLEGYRFRRGQGPLAQHFYRARDHDRSVFTSTGPALNFHQLAGTQHQPVGYILQVDAGRLVLNEARVQRRVIERHHAFEPHFEVLLGLFGSQPAHLDRKSVV